MADKNGVKGAKQRCAQTTENHQLRHDTDSLFVIPTTRDGGDAVALSQGR
jgi:hypothetical protein